MRKRTELVVNSLAVLEEAAKHNRYYELVKEARNYVMDVMWDNDAHDGIDILREYIYGKAPINRRAAVAAVLSAGSVQDYFNWQIPELWVPVVNFRQMRKRLSKGKGIYIEECVCLSEYDEDGYVFRKDVSTWMRL